MAVVSARRASSDRGAKHRPVKNLTLAETSLANASGRMSLNSHSQHPTIPEQEVLLSPTFAVQADLSGGELGISTSAKKRKSSKTKIHTELRRATSTPHIRGLTMADAAAASAADKRRNKLGYHRSSVACGQYS